MGCPFQVRTQHILLINSTNTYLRFTVTALFWWLISVQIISAQVYDFQSFTVENGLSQSQILCLHQSKNGELWMGTNQGGINKFNGSEFNYITKAEGLTDNIVYTIVQEKSGRTLVGTNNGITVVDGTKIDSLAGNYKLPHPGVVSILISKAGTIWLGTGKGVATLTDKTISLFTADSVLSSSTIINMSEGENGSIWFSTVQSGVFRLKSNGVIDRWSTKEGLGHNYVFDVMPMANGQAWVFNYKGFYLLKNDSLSQVNVPNSITRNAIYYGYEKDLAGNIWIGTSQGVLKHFHGKFTHLTTSNGLVNDNIWKILQDREGNIWFGSKSNGASKLNSERFKIYTSTKKLPNTVVLSVFKDNKNQLWSGTNKGLVVWGGNEIVKYDETDGLSSEAIRDIDQGQDGALYAATNFGLSVFDGEKFTSYESPETDLNSIHNVYAKGGAIWLGTQVGPAIFKSGKFVRPMNATKFDKPVFDIVEHNGNIWFAYDDGVLRFDGKSFTRLSGKDGFFDGRARSIAVGPEGNLWFGTNNGVYRFDGDSCINFGVEDGLISDAVYSLGFHQDGSLWVGQSRGLSRLLFDGNELEDVIIYGKEQGFLGLECSTNSICMGGDGKIWIGATNGLVEYDPKRDKGIYYKPLTRITDVMLFSQSTDWLQYTDSINQNGIPNKPELPFDKNDIRFEFSGVSLTSPASMNYSFYLEGFDLEWQKVTHNDFARYSNIPPGDYTFKVRAGFGDELWKNTPISFSFTISPPFYQTNWFYIICALVISGAVYSYVTIRQANIQITEQKQKIELQKDVIEVKNKAMLDSINYASTIQSATLPSEDEWFKLLPDSFVLYKPKDIVSGDFYWLGNNKKGDVFFSSVDCTGHGVPGALMSIVGYNGLNQAINQEHLNEPAQILNYLRKSVNQSLRKSERDDYVPDGMDVSFCKLNYDKKQVEFAGALNPILIVRNGEPLLTKGDRISIGNLDTNSRSFTNHTIDLQPGDCLYIYSDGYADQFGGPAGKKMKTSVMRQHLVSVSKLPMADQRKVLEQRLAEWQGTLDQVDDICLIGVRV
jgi:ligand-binding sensor domain-containing protein/serine phosphatase RsbU (regulator of sigma subunit)